jgi:phosphate transport system substrate-binding protein
LRDHLRTGRATTVLLAVSLLTAACAGAVQDSGTATADTEPSESTTPTADKTGGAETTTDGLSGSIVVTGSSTVEPITNRVAESFSADHPGVGFNISGPGTGDGFAAFCNGEADIQDASRPIKEEEAAICEENGIGYIELYVAIDGLSVLTSPENDAITCLSYADLYALLGPESTGFTSWSDADALAAELEGSNAPYPDAPLQVTAPGEESGTYDSFTELVFKGIAGERGQEAEARPDYTASPNDNVIVDGIAGSPTSLGWVGYAFYEENRDVLRSLEVDGGGGCVAPTDESIADGTYPLARSLYLYVSTDSAAANPAVAAFVDYYLGDAGYDAVASVGYVQLPEADWTATGQAWAAR